MALLHIYQTQNERPLDGDLQAFLENCNAALLTTLALLMRKSLNKLFHFIVLMLYKFDIGLVRVWYWCDNDVVRGGKDLVYVVFCGVV